MEAGPPGAGTPGARPTVRIGADVLDAIVEHARATLPDECCGLLIGTSDLVKGAWPARNELASPARYRVDPRDYLAAARFARARGLDVVGAYHSHPRSPAVPSPTDVAESAGDRFLYLIAGNVQATGTRDLRAYLYGDGNFREVRVVAVPQENPR